MIRIHLDSGEMQVLQYLLKASRGPQRVTFRVVYDEIRRAKGNPPTRVWVYECLKKLEADGFITADQLPRPRSYFVSTETMANGLERAWKNRLDSLDGKIELLTRTSAEDMAAFLYRCATGSPTQQSTGVARGAENVRRLIRSELLDRKQWKPGDILNLVQRLDNLVDAEGIGSPVAKEIVSAAKGGLNVHAVFIPSETALDGMGDVASSMPDEGNQLASLLMSGHLQIRIYPEDVATYRIVALNRDKLVMILTNAFRPDMAVLLDRAQQPVMVEHAMQRFDALWDQSVDARELMASLFAESGNPGAGSTG